MVKVPVPLPATVSKLLVLARSSLRVPDDSVKFLLAASVTVPADAPLGARVPPATVRLPPSVVAATLLVRVPPLTFMSPVALLKAAAFPSDSVPLETVVAPVYVFDPVSASVPAPALVRPVEVPFAIAPERVR